MDGSAFIARLRARVPGARPAVAIPPAPPLRAPDSPSERPPWLLDRFRAHLLRVGGSLAPAERGDQAALELARAHGLTSFVAWSSPLLARDGVAAALVAAGLRAVSYPSDPAAARRALDEADLGVVEADLAIAESGTVGLLADPSRGRLVSCLPRTLLVLLDRARLLPRLEDLPGWLAARGALPSSLALVTGPSRTGDIGARPVIGAHGPARLHVALL